MKETGKNNKIEKFLNNCIHDFEFAILRMKWYVQWKIKTDLNDHEKQIFKLCKQLTNYYAGKRSYKIEEIVDEFMYLQEIMVSGNSIRFKDIVTTKMIISDILYTNEMTNTGFPITREISAKIQDTFDNIYHNINTDEYLDELEIEMIIRKCKRSNYGYEDKG